MENKMAERKPVKKPVEHVHNDTLMAEATVLAALITKGASGVAAVESAKHYVTLLKEV